MFQRFTDRARRVVVLAQEEARLLNHGWIGTEHLLLALLAEQEGVAAQALTAQGTDLDRLRRVVGGMIGQGTGPVTGHIPFTPRAKKVLELSLREAIGLDHDYIGTEHLLLGLLRERDGVACQALQAEGIDLDGTRRKVADLLGVDPKVRPPRRSREPLWSRGGPAACRHPDDALEIHQGQGLRSVRCRLCGTLVGVLPDA